jgi:hypothetical protein
VVTGRAKGFRTLTKPAGEPAACDRSSTVSEHGRRRLLAGTVEFCNASCSTYGPHLLTVLPARRHCVEHAVYSVDPGVDVHNVVRHEHGTPALARARRCVRVRDQDPVPREPNLPLRPLNRSEAIRRRVRARAASSALAGEQERPGGGIYYTLRSALRGVRCGRGVRRLRGTAPEQPTSSLSPCARRRMRHTANRRVASTPTTPHAAPCAGRTSSMWALKKAPKCSVWQGWVPARGQRRKHGAALSYVPA